MKLTELPATTEDISTIFAMAKELIDTYEDLESIQYDKVISWVQSKIEDHISEYSCVFFKNVKIGYYRLVHGMQSLELDDLYILPEHRNKGYGSQILRTCYQSSELPIFLYVFCRNTDAIRFYVKHGFWIQQQVSPTRYIMIRND